MIDTHCHLTFPDYGGGVAGVIERARANGLFGCVSISTTTRDCWDALEIARAFPEFVRCTAGVHPLHAHEGPHDWDRLLRVARDPLCTAFGELGLDMHYGEPTQQVQRAVLDEQLERIQRWRAEDERVASLPVVIHCREAFEALIPVLGGTSIPADRFVFHCFTGTRDDMRRVLDFGAWVSFTGVLTYKNADEVRGAAKLAPLDRVMVETDAPFLSPEPHRKVRPNEPALVRSVAECLAERVHGRAIEEVEEILDENARRFFPRLMGS